MRPLFVSGLFAIAVASPTFAQIVPATDGLGTQVTIDGAQIDITGGRTSSDDTNLFHSFESFNLGTGEAANFQVLPNIENILGRVVGGSGSLVDGLLGVTGGDANLYLIDPAGIVFGENARLDVAGDFVATTATSVGFGDRWLDVMGNNIWSELVGNPTGFGFAGTGAIVNLGELTVDSGQNIGLFGDAVINAGSLSAPGGGVAIVASEAGDRIRLGIPGNVLSLEVDREALHADPTALALPEVMSGEVESAGAIVRDADGSIRLGASPVSVEPLVGDALVSGAIDVASTDGVGGTALGLGGRVGLLAGALDASGRDGGGAGQMGGKLRGRGARPDAGLAG
ncbi:MAG: filamentous hemagglutinin N-terminal domain-containing protein, partial [Geitlerinemataceae cyanobacterium]